MVDIIILELETLFVGGRGAAVDRPPAGDAGFDRFIFLAVAAVFLALANNQRAGTNQGKLAS